MKRKMAMVLLTLVTAVSLVFGMTTIAAQAATELVLGEVSTENTKNAAIEIGCEQFTNGGEDVDLTVNGKEYVTLTTNGTTYNASHIRQVYSRKTFRVYFWARDIISVLRKREIYSRLRQDSQFRIMISPYRKI